MLWFLVTMLVILLVLAGAAIFLLAEVVADDREQEALRIEVETRRAERRIHDVASSAFQAMLDTARAHDPRVK
jgi:hypothetical protein